MSIVNWEDLCELEPDGSSDFWYALHFMSSPIYVLARTMFAPLSIRRIAKREWARRMALEKEEELQPLLDKIDESYYAYIRSMYANCQANKGTQ